MFDVLEEQRRVFLKHRVLFVCVQNAGRSQMAEAFARILGSDVLEASSAGTRPGRNVNPIVAEVMKERGIDISGNTPRLLTEQLVRDADVIITMGCSIEEACPAPILKRSIDWSLEDPKGKRIEEVRPIRDQIERNVTELIRSLRSSTGIAGVVHDKRTLTSES